MDEITLDTIRANPKPVEEYSEQEINVIKEHKELLDDEEKWAFQDLIREDVAEPTTEEAVTEPAAEATPAPVEDVKEAVAAAPEVAFKTKEEIDAYINKAIEEREAAKPKDEQLSKEEKKDEAAALKQFLPEGYIPKDPNEFLNAMLSNPDVVNALREKLSPGVAEDIQKREAERKQAIAKQNTIYDAQYDKLASEGKVPARGTEEGKLVDAQIANLSVKYGIDNYIDGYDLWSKTPKEYGGGYGAAAVEAPKKDTIKEQKKAASMVNGGGSDDAKTPAKAKGFNYATDHGKDLDTIIDKYYG